MEKSDNSLREELRADDDELVFFGGEVKALRDGRVGGYLVRFSTQDDPDLTGDYFTPETDFGSADKSDVWFNHRIPIKLKKHNVSVKYTESLGKATLKNKAGAPDRLRLEGGVRVLVGPLLAQAARFRAVEERHVDAATVDPEVVQEVARPGGCAVRCPPRA